MKVDPLTFSLVSFRDEVEKISRRGKLTLDLMQREGAPQQRINDEELALSREILHLRIKYTQLYGERLTKIIQSCG